MTTSLISALHHTAIRALLTILGTVALPTMADPGAEAIRDRIEQFRATGELALPGGAIASMAVAPELYEQRDFQPAWTSRRRMEELIQLVGRAGEHGLDPADYHHDVLVAMSRLPLEHPEQRADFDLMLTDSLARYAYHMIFGKVDPVELDSNWNLSREMGELDPVVAMQKTIDSDSIEDALRAVLGQRPLYDRLVQLLADYRKLARDGGWTTVSAGPTLKPGMQDRRVAELRRRLAVAPNSSPEQFDATLQQAVERFQTHHGLESDGAVGPRTLAALNVPISARIDQIRINLERARWVFRDIPAERPFILVNIAGFRVALIRGRQLIWQARAQVGKPYRKTPVFRAELEYLVFNPTWTVPPTILAKDILPKVKADLSYLEAKRIKVIDRSGTVVDPTQLDWSSITPKTFPYALRQDPGPENALGLVKFIFPNPHFVFLHDTPHREGFSPAQRAFSSGCIRVEDPFELADLLLDDEQWDREAIDALVESGRTKTVFLEEPMPVMLLYATVDIMDGDARFLPDVYQRDPRVLKALEEEFRFTLVP